MEIYFRRGKGKQFMMFKKEKVLKVYYFFRNKYYSFLYKKSGRILKDNNLWIFGAWQGKMYADNSKYLFRYINENHPNIRCVWVSRSPHIISMVKKEGYEAYLINSKKGHKLIMKAGVVFMTEGTYDVGGYLHKNAIQIQLWHGMGIKDVKKFQHPQNIISEDDYSALAYAHKEDYWMTSCNEAIKKYSEAYGIDLGRMFITGQPKDDTFVVFRENKWISQIRLSKPMCKIIVYLPTHRGFGRHEKENMHSFEKLVEVNRYLSSNNIVMIFKPHFHEFQNYKGMDTSLSNIIFFTDLDKYGDVYEFLPACDALLTDYSGIMLGYLTSGKPIIYFPYDINTYMNSDAGFCYSYDEVTAGPICYTWEEVVREVTKIFVQDNYAGQRERLRQRFSPFNDGKNSERVYKQVIKLIENKENER